MCHLTPFEAERGLYLVAFAQKADSLVLLGLIVMLVDGDRKLDLFDDNDLLLLAGGAVAFVFLVEEFAVVLDLADGRDSIWGDFDEVERALPGHFQGVEGGHDAELLAV